MMKQLFPIRHVMGYLASLVLSAAALVVIYGDLSDGANMAVLLITALIQAFSAALRIHAHRGIRGYQERALYQYRLRFVRWISYHLRNPVHLRMGLVRLRTR